VKRLKWVSLKRHIALPLVAIVVVFLIALLVLVRAAKEQGTYRVAHVYGDSSVMEGITISGAIIDANHKTSFTWQDAQVDINTEAYPNPQSDWQYRYYSGFYQRINDYYYRVDKSLVRVGLSVERNFFNNGNFDYVDSAIVDIPIKPLFKKSDKVTEFTNLKTYGLAEVAGHIYFTLVTTEKYKGENGIYKLNFKDWDQQTPPIVTFSLDSNNEEYGTRIAVLGLEAVGDKLALILVKDNALVIEGYRTDGSKLGEAVVAPFLFNQINAELADEDASVRYQQSYEAYSHAENGMLSLSFLNNQSQRTVVTVQSTNEGIQLVDKTEISKEDQLLRENSEYLQGERFIKYKDGKLYYVGVFREHPDKEGNVWEYMLPIRLLVNVYEQGNIVYTGELITDVNDDLLRIDDRDVYNFNYDWSEYRNFYDLYIH